LRVKHDTINQFFKSVSGLNSANDTGNKKEQLIYMVSLFSF